MNQKKWKKFKDISLLQFNVKLSEELGEVASELGDYHDLPNTKSLVQMHNELDHVVFVATQMQNRVEWMLDNGP